MLQQILAIFLVLGLLLASLWLLRRQGLATSNIAGLAAGFKGFTGKQPPKRLRVLERLVLTPQHCLHLVQVEEQLLLFATSPHGCQPVDPALLGSFQTAGNAGSFRNGATC